jgi:HK97 gp10 family phage protein
MTVKWKNADRFHKKLSKLPPTVGKAAKEGLIESAEFIVEAMKRQVPVRSGALRDSITFTKPDANALRDNRVTITAGNKQAFYAKFVEYGTQKMRAEPFFWTTWRAFRRSAKSHLSRKVNKAIKALANG